MPTTEDSLAVAAHFGGRTVLVTGAFGFIGTHVSARLAAAGANVLMLNRRSVAQAVPSGATAVPGDLLEQGLWDRILPGVDVVFHLAAQTSAKRSEQDPITDYRLNTEATSRMLDACR